ncbi:MAG: hypothetical protein FJ098_15930, partial [Deltaproteobacteria bacterium]|nr:hypothetical protein [Deltaproteobacteria bacterium]
MKDTLLVMGGAAAGTLAVAALLLGLRASADGLQTSSQVPKLLAWHGTLEKDGAAVDGTVQMTFALLDGAAATTPAWSEVQSVPVFGGRFSVLLGATSAAKQDALAATVRAADDLYLRVSVLDGESWVPLSSPTRFVPVPYSHWTMAGTDISANGVDGLQSGGKLFLNYHTKA